MKPLSCIAALLAASGVNAKVTNLPKKDIVCGNIRAFKPSDVEAAGNAALQHKDNPIGARKYPHIYHFNRPDCGSELWGYPLLWTFPYNGGDPLLSRAIFTFVQEGGELVARYCGTYAHKTRPDDKDFYQCKDS
ncbi:SSCRP protein [Trichoderma parareesei]|uniref:SSCRP protein n=1 Tax=Trichoderma parareesei TaxID=858221 RepID=A0A2H2ZME5_TRIPA|nr:SSCRP protein [Trichoderma parareesei]